MNSWTQFLRWCCFFSVIAVIGTLVYVSVRPRVEDPVCHDMSELRSTAEGSLKCHSKATLEVHWGGSIPDGYVLDICRCK